MTDNAHSNMPNDFPLGLSPDALVALADYAGIGILNWHIPSNEIRLNEPIVKLTGYEMYEIPHSGNSRRMMTFEDDYAMVESNIQACLEGKQDRYQIVYRMNRRDGSIVSVLESAFVYEKDAQGRAVRLAAMVADLSSLKQAEQKIRSLEQENQRLRAGMSKGELAGQNHLLRAANSAAAGIVGGFYQDYENTLLQALKIIGESLGADSMQIYRNVPTNDGMLCYLRSSWMVSQDLPITVDTEATWDYDDIMPDWRETLRVGKNLCFAGADIPRSLRLLPGMEKVRGMMLIPLLLHGAFWGLLRVDAWETERLFTPSEAEIIGSGIIIVASSISRNETLGKLNEAREEAMASTRAKGEFLSRMSHEIRTPMNAIIGMSAIARKTEDMEKVQYALDKIDTSSKQLLSIINDVLDMSKIDSGKFEINVQPFDFDRMVQNVLNVIQVKLDEKHQTLHFELDTVFTHEVISDELRLSQVLINLLSNAVKFTPEEGHITLKVSRKNTGQNTFRLHVEVKDTGIGMNEESQSRLFNQFEQADNSISRRYGGTGLGLAISKRIVNLMGGDIWVQSKEGHGSTFLFEIEAEWGDVLTHSSKVATPSKKLRILVVDDAADVREYFTSVLESFSQICETAANGREAVKLAKQRMEEGTPFDLYFIDWNMPGMNGGRTAEAIRKITGEDTIVEMISVSDWNDIQEEAKQFGVTHFLAKPVMPSTLYNNILQLTRENMIRTEPNNIPSFDWHGKTVLLAEDIEINREIMHTLLEDTGVVLEDAENGQIAVDMYTAHPEKYDLVLMDVQMPVMDGLTATRAIRALSAVRAKEVPIVAMTANAFKEDQEASLAAGMNGHIAKPIELNVLYDTLNKYLGK